MNNFDWLVRIAPEDLGAMREYYDVLLTEMDAASALKACQVLILLYGGDRLSIPFRKIEHSVKCRMAAQMLQSHSETDVMRRLGMSLYQVRMAQTIK